MRKGVIQSYSDNFADNQLIESLNLVELMSSYNRSYEMRRTQELEIIGLVLLKFKILIY